MSDRRDSPIQTISVAGRILRHFARAQRPLSLTDVNDALGLRPPTTHRYLAALVEAEFLHKDAETRRYILGSLSALLGTSAISRSSLTQEAIPFMGRLRAELDQTVILSIWTERGATIIDWMDPSRPVIVSVRIGSTLPLLRSATGRLFAAFLPRARYARLLDEELRLGEGGPSLLEFETLLADIRASRISRVNGDVVERIGAFAAPVFSRGGELIATLTVLGIVPSFNSAWESDEARAVATAASELSLRFGFIGETRVL